MFRSFLCAIVLITASLARAQEQRPLDTRVDPRVELLSIVARLAEFPEFNMENSASPYSRAVEQRFGPFRDHPAVRTLKKLRANDSVSYDAIPSLAVHLVDVETLAERVDFARVPERLDVRWGGVKARAFLAQLRDFTEQSKAVRFFAEQRPLYAEVERRLADRLVQSPALPWFDTFFGARPGTTCVAIAGLLCGGGNFGVGVRFADGSPEQLTPVFGCWTFDDKGVPVFGDVYGPLLVHEICHSYTNPFVDRFQRELEAAGKQIHASCLSKMTVQSYGTWKTMMYESLVRACVVRCRLETEGRDAAKAQAAEETSKHFLWVPELAGVLGEYEADRAKYRTFDLFMPRIVSFFDTYSKALAERVSKQPKVLALAPENGATDVDPASTTLVITFDRAMRDKSWSVVGAPPDVPPIRGVRYDASRKVLTLDVTLEPGRTYHVGLNDLTHKGFCSDEGVALEPYVFSFTTRK